MPLGFTPCQGSLSWSRAEVGVGPGLLICNPIFFLLLTHVSSAHEGKMKTVGHIPCQGSAQRVTEQGWEGGG